VDVGAGDPVLDSVTAAFADRGWRGVNVEPLLREHERLCAARPADINLRVALGCKAGLGKLFVEPTEKRRSRTRCSDRRGASTMVPELAERYRAEGQEFTPIEVPIWTLAQVVGRPCSRSRRLPQGGRRGFRARGARRADWSSFRPRVVVMEATVPNSDEPAHEAWEPILFESGYRFAMFDGLNRFYALADEPALLQALAIPANVFDDFVPYAWRTRSTRHNSGPTAWRTRSPGATTTRPALRGCDTRTRNRPPRTRPGCNCRRERRQSACRDSPCSHRTARAEGDPHL